MRRAVILFAISVFLLSTSAVFAQEDRCDFNNNGVNDVADLIRIIDYVGGSEMLDSLPKYWEEGDCDCDNLHLTVTDAQSLARRMIYGYGPWSRGSQIFSESDVISIPPFDAVPGVEVDVPVYIETERDLLGLQFYVPYDPNLINISDFSYSDTLMNGFNRVYLFDGGVSVCMMSEDYDFNGLIGYLRATVNPATPVGAEILLAFGNNPHRALYTGLADSYSSSDESRIIGLHFIHPVKNDGIVNVVEGRLIEDDENTFLDLSASPNPFNNSTNLTFQIERQSQVRIDIFDMLGRRISSVLNSDLSAGSHSVVWNPDQLPSGVYFCRMAADDHSITKRITLLK